MGVMLACAYLLDTAQAETIGIQAIKAVKAIAGGRYITMDAATFQDSYEHHIDMQQVTGFEVSVNGLQLYFADGTGYLVQDAHKLDMRKGKYILTVKVNDVYKLCYDMFYKLLYFDTIKDEQREVLYSADFIRTM